MNRQDVEQSLRAAAIAHAIRLGKCPRPGQVMSGKCQVREIEQKDWDAGLVDRAAPVSDLVEIEFVVTTDDIQAGIDLINKHRAVYREPRMTTVRL